MNLRHLPGTILAAAFLAAACLITACQPDAVGGFAAAHEKDGVEVDFPEALLKKVPHEKRAALLSALRQDPRPAYHNDPARLYGFSYAGYDVRFRVAENTLTVTEIIPLEGL